jgi:hypothetical protein
MPSRGWVGVIVRMGFRVRFRKREPQRASGMNLIRRLPGFREGSVFQTSGQWPWRKRPGPHAIKTDLRSYELRHLGVQLGGEIPARCEFGRDGGLDGAPAPEGWSARLCHPGAVGEERGPGHSITGQSDADVAGPHGIEFGLDQGEAVTRRSIRCGPAGDNEGDDEGTHGGKPWHWDSPDRGIAGHGARPKRMASARARFAVARRSTSSSGTIAR